MSPATTAHAASSTSIQATSGQVRVPRLGQRDLAVAVEEHGEQGGDGGQAGPTEPTAGQPQPGADGDEVDDDRAGLHRPRRRPEQAVRRGEQVEAERSRVAALVRVLADAPGQPDQRRVPARTRRGRGTRSSPGRAPGATVGCAGRRRRRSAAARRGSPTTAAARDAVALDRRGQTASQPPAAGRASVAAAVSITPVTVASTASGRRTRHPPHRRARVVSPMPGADPLRCRRRTGCGQSDVARWRAHPTVRRRRHRPTGPCAPPCGPACR